MKRFRSRGISAKTSVAPAITWNLTKGSGPNTTKEFLRVENSTATGIRKGLLYDCIFFKRDVIYTPRTNANDLIYYCPGLEQTLKSWSHLKKDDLSLVTVNFRLWIYYEKLDEWYFVQTDPPFLMIEHNPFQMSFEMSRFLIYFLISPADFHARNTFLFLEVILSHNGNTYIDHCELEYKWLAQAKYHNKMKQITDKTEKPTIPTNSTVQILDLNLDEGKENENRIQGENKRARTAEHVDTVSDDVEKTITKEKNVPIKITKKVTGIAVKENYYYVGPHTENEILPYVQLTELEKEDAKLHLFSSHHSHVIDHINSTSWKFHFMSKQDLEEYNFFQFQERRQNDLAEQTVESWAEIIRTKGLMDAPVGSEGAHRSLAYIDVLKLDKVPHIDFEGGGEEEEKEKEEKEQLQKKNETTESKKVEMIDNASHFPLRLQLQSISPNYGSGYDHVILRGHFTPSTIVHFGILKPPIVFQNSNIICITVPRGVIPLCSTTFSIYVQDGYDISDKCIFHYTSPTKELLMGMLRLNREVKDIKAIVAKIEEKMNLKEKKKLKKKKIEEEIKK